MTSAPALRAFVAALLLLTACGSSTGSSDTVSSTSTSVAATTTTSTTVAATTTMAAPTTAFDPSSSAPEATAPPSPTEPPPGPRIDAFLVSQPAACAAPDASFSAGPPMVTVSWVAKAADSVYLAIDNPDGPFATDLALSGSAQVPFACPGPHTYYVVALSGAQKASASQVVG